MNCGLRVAVLCYYYLIYYYYKNIFDGSYFSSPSRLNNLHDQMGVKNDEMVFFDNDYIPKPEKGHNYVYIGLIAVAVKKILLILFAIFVLPVVLFKLLAFVVIPMKFLFGLKAFGLANAALLSMLFLRQALTPSMPYSPLALG
jgi:hypothetical protein